ncbi:ABC transporter permease [Nocardiopsis changdeensis]|uniref:Transport permease protein n=1 Tax=Nocardiopsis changdeensis TaxID=2831969 RepID=A0ABX8BLF1_9ACTN|nr:MULTISPECIES: ABC transporter permease [Nocardiopsis]QUX22899.1 ABC transporter permease [Nocardiopsis changdeensis]QYX38842.1 ABC transporter permease [Nocardiopsis sp. MT53]
MRPALTGATALRILRQLRHDPRTVALLLLVPSLLLVLLRFVFDDEAFFARLAPQLVAIFPFVVLFLITSIATLRERRSGTLERLMTLPVGRFDLLLGYALAFGLVAVAQVAVVIAVALWLGMETEGSLWTLGAISLADALLGIALGLFASAFAHSEFQVVQFMPAFVMPQVLLCGLFAPREDMADALYLVSAVMPLSYAVDAITEAVERPEVTGDLLVDTGIVLGSAVLALLLGAATLRRRTP